MHLDDYNKYGSMSLLSRPFANIQIFKTNQLDTGWFFLWIEWKCDVEFVQNVSFCFLNRLLTKKTTHPSKNIAIFIVKKTLHKIKIKLAEIYYFIKNNQH